MILPTRWVMTHSIPKCVSTARAPGECTRCAGSATHNPCTKEFGELRTSDEQKGRCLGRGNA